MDSAIFGGRQVLDLVISEGGQFTTVFFLLLNYGTGKFGGGKKDQPPCICNFSILVVYRRLLYVPCRDVSAV